MLLFGHKRKRQPPQRLAKTHMKPPDRAAQLFGLCIIEAGNTFASCQLPVDGGGGDGGILIGCELEGDARSASTSTSTRCRVARFLAGRAGAKASPEMWLRQAYLTSASLAKTFVRAATDTTTTAAAAGKTATTQAHILRIRSHRIGLIS